MGITAYSGPLVSYGITQGSTGQVQEYNEERGPSLFDMGQGTLDPRYQFNYRPGSPVGTAIVGLFDQTGTVDYVPFAAGSSSILVSSASGQPVAGTALTLAAISSLGAFQTTIIAPETGGSVSVIAIDSTAATVAFGTGGTVTCWNPAGGTGRGILVINTSNANSEAYVVRGRDMYGFKMTELISASTTSTGAGQGKKAFKYITSVTPSTTTTISATGVSVGFSDTYGLPFKASYMNGISVQVSSGGAYAGNIITLSTGNAVVASTVATQTSTTPDVRGTYTSSIASAGSTAAAGSSAAMRLTIQQYLTASVAAKVTATDASAIFGVTQFSDF